MSIRIYKGFVVDTADFRELYAKVAAFRPWVLEQANAQLDRFMENMSVAGPVAAYDVWQDRRETVRRTNRRDPAVDTQFTLSFIPLADKTLGIAYVESSAWFEAWLRQPGVAYYGYWTSEDCPSDVADADWEQRGRDWAILGGSPVSERSFSIELLAPQQPVPKNWR